MTQKSFAEMMKPHLERSFGIPAGSLGGPVDLAVSPEAILTLKDGEKCTLLGTEFTLTEFSTNDTFRGRIFLSTPINSPRDEDYPSIHVRVRLNSEHRLGVAVMSRQEMLNALQTSSYTIE